MTSASAQVATVGQTELIICSAVLMGDGYIVRGHRHCDCIHVVAGMPRYVDSLIVEQGFMTSRNRFVSRKEARVIHGKGSSPTQLFSEDLY
jgi:hypothetical protein